MQKDSMTTPLAHLPSFFIKIYVHPKHRPLHIERKKERMTKSKFNAMKSALHCNVQHALGYRATGVLIHFMPVY